MIKLSLSLGQKDILEILTARKILTSEKAEFIRRKFTDLASQARVLLEKNLAPEEEVAKAAAAVLNLPFIKIQGRKLETDLLTIIPYDLAVKFKVIAFERDDRQTPARIKVAVGQPYRLDHKSANQGGPLRALEEQKQIKIELYATTLADINWALGVYEQRRLNQADQTAGTKAEGAAGLKISDLPKVKLDIKDLNWEIVRKIPKEIIEKYQLVLFEIDSDGSFKVGLVDPFDRSSQEILDFIRQKNHVRLKKFQISQTDLVAVLAAYDQRKAGSPSLADSSTDSPQSAADLPDSASSDSSAAVAVQFASGAANSPSQPTPGVKIKDGVYYLAETSIQKPRIALDKDKVNLAVSGQSLEETNLDKFLGKMIETTAELVGVIQQGFIPRVVAAILSLGVKLRASDVHLEAGKKYLRLRYRVDGELHDFVYLPLKMHPPIISRIKILSGLKIDEQRIPQDGRYNAIASGHEIDVRVSSFPTVHGEKIVMRLLDKTTSQFKLEELGLVGRNLKIIQAEIQKPWGVIVSTGPTGSGKSTTLYSILNTISKPEINIITLEDPVEYDIPGINQAQVKPKIGFSFAEGLRSILRQDPNVIMVGEVRDSETANLVTHAALTGHLVLTTLHTNDAASAMPRLTNMKVEPYLITSSINVIIAQRLVRKLCPKCKQPVKVPPDVLEKLNTESSGVGQPANKIDLSGVTFYGPGRGCNFCHQGYKGRIGIFEVLVMSEEIEKLAIRDQPASEIRKQAIKEGMITMRQDGIEKAKQGIISLQDVLQATSR